MLKQGSQLSNVLSRFNALGRDINVTASLNAVGKDTGNFFNAVGQRLKVGRRLKSGGLLSNDLAKLNIVYRNINVTQA